MSYHTCFSVTTSARSRDRSDNRRHSEAVMCLNNHFSSVCNKCAVSVISTADKSQTPLKRLRSLGNLPNSWKSCILAELVKIKMQKPFPSKFTDSLNSAHGPHALK